MTMKETIHAFIIANGPLEKVNLFGFFFWPSDNNSDCYISRQEQQQKEKKKKMNRKEVGFSLVL